MITTVEIIAGFVLIIYGILEGIKWKELSKIRQLFVVLAILGAITITIIQFVNRKTEQYDYLLKNKANLNCFMYVDKIKADSILYHLVLQNERPITANNIKYFIESPGEREGVAEEIEGEIGQGDSRSVYPIGNSVGGFLIQNNLLSVKLSLSYDSIWGEDTLNDNVKYEFLIPTQGITRGRLDPTKKFPVMITSITENVYNALVNQFKEETGTVYLVFFEKDAPPSLGYIFRAESESLIFNKTLQQVIFQKLFNNRKTLTLICPTQSRKGHIITITWSYGHYTLQIDKDPPIAGDRPM